MPQFSPLANTAVLNAGTTSTSVALPLPGKATRWIHAVQVFNSGTVTAFVALGVAGVVAAIPTAGSPQAGAPVPAGQVVELVAPINAPCTTVAAITASGTATLYLTAGESAA